jgi:hypothetical protein
MKEILHKPVELITLCILTGFILAPIVMLLFV